MDLQKKSSNSREHLANERTFLAWIRTSVGILAFGFVVEKFGLFLRQISFVLEKFDSPMANAFPEKYKYESSILGLFLVILGIIICLLAFVKYKKVEREIESESYKPSILLNVMLTLAVLLIGVFLIIYLSSNF